MSDRLKELREKRAKLVHDARVEMDSITDETSAEDAVECERKFDAMMTEVDALTGKIDREERLATHESQLDEVRQRRSGQEDLISDPADDPNDGAPVYKDVFGKALRHGVAELSSEERTILQGGSTDIPGEVRAQAAGSDSAGGYTVPEEFSGEIDKSMAAWGPMWEPGISREIVTSNGRNLKWPTVDDTAKTGRIKLENTSVDDDNSDDVAFGEKELNAYVYDTGMVRIPLELLQDSAFNMEALINDLFGERLGRTANTVLTTGTGSSQPNGVVTASGLGVTAAGAAAIASDELINLLHSVDPAYRASPSVRWMFNDSTLAAIRKLKDGQGNYLWQLGDIRNGEPAQILGHPYAVNQAMDSLATGNKTILFGDFSRYVVRKVMGFQVMTLRERYAEKFQIGMVGFKRFDGELMNAAAVKHLVQA